MKGTKRIFSFLLIISILSTIIILPVTVSAETKVVDYSCEIVDGIMRVTANVEVDGSNTSYRTGGIIVTGYDEYGNAIETQSACSTIMVGGSKKTLTVDMQAGADIKAITVIPNKGVGKNEVRSYGKRIVDDKLHVTACIEISGSRSSVEQGGIIVVGYDKNGNIVETQSAYDGMIVGTSVETLSVDLEAVNEIDSIEVFTDIDPKQNIVRTFGKRILNNNLHVTANIEIPGRASGIEQGGIIVVGYDKNGNIVETRSAYDGSIIGGSIETLSVDLEAVNEIDFVEVFTDIDPVSYTHLDVYKRQAFLLLQISYRILAV